MSEPGHPETPAEPAAASHGSRASAAESAVAQEWPPPELGDAIIAVAGTGAVTAMNLAAVSLLGSPAPHELRLGVAQFVPERYHRVIDAWSEREPGDARAAHEDPLTLSMSALRSDGAEVRVLLTRRMLGEGPHAPYLVTLRTVPTASGPLAPQLPAVPRRVRHRRDHPSPVLG